MSSACEQLAVILFAPAATRDKRMPRSMQSMLRFLSIFFRLVRLNDVFNREPGHRAVHTAMPTHYASIRHLARPAARHNRNSLWPRDHQVVYRGNRADGRIVPAWRLNSGAKQYKHASNNWKSRRTPGLVFFVLPARRHLVGNRAETFSTANPVIALSTTDFDITEPSAGPCHIRSII